MKRLFILRHAKSPPAPLLRDFDRPLNDVGRAAAAAIGAEMQSLGLTVDAAVASPARRVVETLDHLGLGPDFTPHFDRRLYAADSETLLDIVRATEDAVGGLLVAGHNPGVAMLARALAADDATEAYRALSAKFPPGALAEISFPADTWSEIGLDGGGLVRFLRPRDLVR